MFAFRFGILHLLGAALLLAGALDGLLMEPFALDPSRLTYVIAAGFVIGLGFAVTRAWTAVRRTSRALVTVGIVGTVYGMTVALSGIDPAAAADVERVGPMVSTLISGMRIAFYTTLVGLVAALWLGLVHAICEPDGR